MMKSFKYYLIALATILLAIVVVTGCKCPQAVTSTVVKDSTSTTIKREYRDTVIRIPADTASIQALVKCPPNGIVNMPEMKVKSKRAIISAKIVNGAFDATCTCPELEKQVKILKETIFQLRQRNSLTTRTATVEVRYIPGWVKVLAWVGVTTLLMLLLLIGFKLYRKNGTT